MVAAATFVLGASVSEAAPEPGTEKTAVAPVVAPATPTSAFKELFPGVHADMSAHIVEIDATVSPMLVPDERAPRFYLEVIACGPSTREHEAFFVIKAKPSHIHAAMLAAGFVPGEPGRVERVGNKTVSVQPKGERLDVRVVYTPKGAEKPLSADPLEWIVNASSVAAPGETKSTDRKEAPAAREAAKTFPEHERGVAKKSADSAEPGWIFTGSRMVKRPAAPTPPPATEQPGSHDIYQADGTGVIIGLTTFGSEVIGWSRAISPDAVVDVPEWVADFSKTPLAGTSVRIRITKAESREPDRPAGPPDSSRP
jgi:hypothetical protein